MQPCFFYVLKRTHSQPLTVAAMVQYQRTSHRLKSIGTPVALERLCFPFSTKDTLGISSQPHPEGEPCTSYDLFKRMYEVPFALFAVRVGVGGRRCGRTSSEVSAELQQQLCSSHLRIGCVTEHIIQYVSVQLTLNVRGQCGGQSHNPWAPFFATTLLRPGSIYIHLPSPGFRVTLISTWQMFIGT